MPREMSQSREPVSKEVVKHVANSTEQKPTALLKSSSSDIFPSETAGW